MFSVPGVNLITGFSQTVQKGRKVERLPDYIINVPAYLLPDGRLLGLGRLPFLMAFSFAFRQNDGQTVFAAQVVRHLLDFFEVGFHIAAQLLSIQKRHGIDCDVVMQVVFIQMGADDNLEPFPEQPLGELHANGVGLFRGQLTRLERLDDVVALYAAHFVIAPLGALHVTAGVLHAAAIQTAFK